MWFPFQFPFWSLDVLAHPQKSNMAFPPGEVWKINVSIQKKSSFKKGVETVIHTKGSKKNHETFHLPWEFSCHLTSASGRWKLHCIHHSCSSWRFLDARIGGWLGSQNSFRKNVDEKPANFMILVDEHPSFSKNILLERTWEHINFFLLRCAIYVKLQPCGSIDVHWPLPEDGELILKRYL